MKANPLRRDFLRSSLLIGSGLYALVRSASPAPAEEEKGSPAAKLNEKQFRQGLLPHAQLSLAASRMAQEKATDAKIKRFAHFELEEVTALTEVLQEMGTVPPPSVKHATDPLEDLEKKQGAEFDKAYIKAQLATHIALKELASAYLRESEGDSPEEKHGRHLAKISLPAFKEHAAVCQYLADSLG